MSQVKSYLLRAYCEPGYVEALGVDRAAGGGRGGRLMKGRGRQESHIELMQGEPEVDVMRDWMRQMGGISGKLSNEASCCSGFRNDHQSRLCRHKETIGDLYNLPSRLEASAA